MIIKGQKINDRYQIIRTIGEGGMANVYLAYDTILNRSVAVKVLRGDLATDEKFVRRFKREAISASSLTHPNIVEMYDVGEDDGNNFIVMEYVDGKTLKSLIKRRGALTLAEVIDIMLQLTSAIACAHESYIIHRDIKPQNVMILDDGRVKITDFGIAIASNAADLTQTNSVMGSVHYLPPEQANGTGATIKSDIYSLGILMYELLTGKVPFKGDNAVEIALKQMKEEIPSVCEHNPEIPQSIENIVLRACAKNPKNRYETVVEMHEDLKTALSSERADELRISYKYPEHDLDETKIMPDLTRAKRNEEVEKELNEIEKKDKKVNIALWITGGACALLAFLICLFVIIIPMFNTVKEVKIPDVSEMSVADAEAELKRLGLEVNTELKEENSDTIAEDMVIGTSPSKSRTVKEGTMITLIVSIGTNKILIEDYTGKNYYEIKGMLEAKGLIVEEPIKKEVEESDEVKENIILEQIPKAGEKLEKGDRVTLTIPDIFTKYPDFVEEKYTADAVQNFCDKHGVTLEIEYLATTDYSPGSIISQDRQAGTRVISPSILKIIVAKEPAIDSLPTTPSLPSDDKTPTTDNSNTDTDNTDTTNKES